MQKNCFVLVRGGDVVAVSGLCCAWVAAARITRAGLTLIIEITKDVGGYCPQLFSLLQSKLIS
jgi:hypothetical protein